ncbi:ATP-binding cassette domain-containing protein, partial [Mesorhizobium sp. ZMM04-5]
MLATRTGQAETAPSQRTAGAAIDIDNVGVTFKGSARSVKAIDNVSLAVREGEFLTLIGHSGCGKSTLLRVIADIIEPTEGSVSIFGGTPANARRSRLFSMVFQQSVLLPWASVTENVRLPFKVGGVDPKVGNFMDPMEALELVQLGGFENSLPAELSGG